MVTTRGGHIKFFLALMLAWVLTAPSARAQTNVMQTSIDKPKMNIAYGTSPVQSFNLYPGVGPGPRKVVFFVHGGGWIKGGKNLNQTFYGPLVAAGYTVVTIGYRLVPQTDVAGSAEDVAHAIAFAFGHAKELGIDPSQFALMGHSSGGNLVSLLATDQSYLTKANIQSDRLAAVITLDAVFDVSASIEHFPQSIDPSVFGTDQQLWRQYSPTNWVHSMQAHTHFCIVQDDTNKRFIEQAAIFEAALTANGQGFDNVVTHGLNHGQLAEDFGDPNEPIIGFALSCLKKTLATN